MSLGSARTLDHIIHLTPPGTFNDAAEQFRQLGFNVIDGGTHTGGLTSNSLVIMPDGTYLELLSFTHPESYYQPSSPSNEARRRHPLANKACGWAAYAFLGVPPSPSPPLSTLLNERLCDAGSSTRYDAEFAVSRKQQQPSSDGDFEIKGEITPPARWSSEKEGGTRLPFFCGDLTPRELRVPTRPRSNTEHPNGALSIAHLRVLASPSVFVRVATELTAIVGESPIQADKDKDKDKEDHGAPREMVWWLDLPGQITPKWRPQLVLREPDIGDEAELRFVETHGAGLFEVGVRVDESGGKRGWSDTPFGRVAWVPTV